MWWLISEQVYFNLFKICALKFGLQLFYETVLVLSKSMHSKVRCSLEIAIALLVFLFTTYLSEKLGTIVVYV